MAKLISMNKAQKVLVVGGGSAGRRHFQYLTDYGQHCTVCDPDPNCRVIQQHPDALRIEDYESADLSSFDAVVICTPPYLHVPQLITAAKAGCHLLSEKPLTVLNDDGLDELQELVRRNNLTAAVSFPYANMKAMDRIIELVQAGKLGRIRSVHVHAGQDILKPRPDYFQTYYVSDAQGGGVLQDDAMHPMMGLEMLLGKEQEVTCQRHNIGIRGKGITADDTNLYVTDRNNHTIRKIVIATGVVSTFAGSAGSSGSTDATGTAARFSYPYGITTDGTDL